MRDLLISVVGVVGGVLLFFGFGFIGETVLALLTQVTGGTQPSDGPGALAGIALSIVGLVVVAVWVRLRGASPRSRT